MPQRIDVPGMGVIEFPDGMNDDQISAAIKQNMPQQGATDKLTGTNGPRYQTWPERLLRGIGGSIASGATLPGDVMSGKAQLPSSGAVPGSVPFGDPASSGERVADLAGLASPLNPAARAGDKAIPGVAKVLRTPEVPTAEALKGTAAEGFNAAKGMGVEFPAPAMSRLGDVLERNLQDKGILPEHAPTAYATIARLRDAPEGAVATISDIHNLRQAFGNAAGSTTHRKDALAGSMGVELVDRILQAVAAKGDVAGPAASASQALIDAIGNYGAGMRSETVTGKTDLAALRAKVSNSGQNLDNATRQRFVDIASEGKAARGFNDSEIAQALRLAEGSSATNTARFVGNALGGGGGLGMAITSGAGAAGGALLGGPVGAGVGATVGPVLGASSKALANALTRREAGKLDELVRMRSPLYESNVANPGTVEGSRSGMEQLVRALMEAGNGARDPQQRKSIVRLLAQ